MHSAATAKQPGPAQPQPSPARSLQGARHGRGHVPHSCRHGAWLGGHRRAAETPLNMRPQCPLSKASAHVQPAWSPQLQGQGNQRRDLWVQSTWPRACPHCFLLRSPLLLPPPQAPFLTLPVLCSATPQPCRPLPAPWGASTQPACFRVTGTVTPHLLHDACPRRVAQSTTSAGGHIRVSGAGGDHGRATWSLLGAP